MDQADGTQEQRQARIAASSTNTQLCQCCFDLNRSLVDLDSKDVYEEKGDKMLCIGRELRHVRESAKSGCEICPMLVKVFAFFRLNPGDIQGSESPPIIWLRLPRGLGGPEISLWHPGFQSRLFVQLYTDTSTAAVWNNIPPLPEICNDHLSDQSLEFMRSCLRKCEDNHPLCHQEDAGLPTRVLDVGTVGDDSIWLLETYKPMSAKYIALSYCWGNTVTIKTLLRNLEEMKSGIAVAELPPTYLDAVTLTRKLGIRYLWIDALCIIQDSEADWEKECSMMSHVYSRAYLTIAAASSTSAGEHFLRPHFKAESYVAHLNSPILSESLDDDSITVKARVIVETGVHWKWQSKSDFRPLIEPLSRRGWALQEKLLSTRLLSISTMEMQWTCKEEVFCECGSSLNHQREFGRMQLGHILEASDAFRFWHKIVESYSMRGLTKKRDKLPAISAVASVLQQTIRSSYASGLWAKNIDLDLLWRRSGPIKETPLSEYIAPTFSWASIDGEIDYYCFRDRHLRGLYQASSEVVAVEVDARPESPLGCVEDGRLTIRGPLSSAIITRVTYDGSWSHCLISGGETVNWKVDTKIQALALPRSNDCPGPAKTAWKWNPSNFGHTLDEGALEFSHRHIKSYKLSALESGRVPDGGVHCWVLRLGSYPAHMGQLTADGRCHELLILGRLSTRDGVYERLGLGAAQIRRSAFFKQEDVCTITMV
ncbi:heterokaryon incompatibility protein-domain-containing protein [Dactylonectria estremocensis]|uniref:Heterokaryon incompatibility protein-domain-containing protein n=1 Tax=Dactylonectria estremocensis TaxID=1079267 RepID=A0A9P9ILN6_9HYPO|nr:heterokaryon incompatibility protein-domain-containing protein [Dactylonectria estremocensis]